MSILDNVFRNNKEAETISKEARTQKSQQTPPITEMGVTGLEHYSGVIFEEFLNKLKGSNATKVFKEMSDNDPVVGGILYMSQQLIKKAKWDVRPCSNSKADTDAAEFVRQCMHDMSYTWDETLGEILSCLTYGWSYHEIVYKHRKGPFVRGRDRSAYDDNLIGWSKLPIRSQDSLYGWKIADNGDVLGMLQQAPPKFEITEIPLNKALLFRTTSFKNNPEGRSLLRTAYRPWFFKKRIEEIEGIGIERDLAGLPMLVPPENVNIWDDKNPDNAKLRQEALNIVQRVRRDQSEGVVIPFGWEFKLLSTGGTRQFDTNAIINRYDNRIAISMLADIIMMGGDKVGSFALADVKKSLLASSLEAQANGIADVFNRDAVPNLFRYNYFPDITGYPQIYCEDIETPSLEELGKFFKATGMRIDDDYELYNFLRSLASLPDITADDFKELQRKRQEAQKQTANATQAKRETDEMLNDPKEQYQAKEGEN